MKKETGQYRAIGQLRRSVTALRWAIARDQALAAAGEGNEELYDYWLGQLGRPQ